MIIIEPHADDAFLSMGGLIENIIKEPVTIVTVFSGTRKRAADAKAYADAVGAKWVGLGFVEDEEAKKRGEAGSFNLDNFPEFDDLIFVLPLGIGNHPDHGAVTRAFQGNTKWLPKQFWYYVDQPYATKLKNQDQLNQALQGEIVRMIYRPGARKYRHIPLFKDQQKFFYYNNETELEMKGFELVVSN